MFQDCRVIIWTNDGTSNNWTSKVLNKFKDVVWHLSWSITGNILAVSGGDNKVSSFNILFIIIRGDDKVSSFNVLSIIIRGDNK